MNSQVSIPKDALAAFCRKHGIRRLSIFGSALREDFGPESDVEVLVELFKALLHKADDGRDTGRGLDIDGNEARR